jgi:hypothetical protein
MALLQSINISHTGVTGSLPASYAALQQLREFRAANCTGITGLLPPTWGLMKLEVLEITNSGLSGSLPLQWADALALSQVLDETQAWAKLMLQADAAILLGAGTADAVHMHDAGDSQAVAQPRALGMSRLRVLDLGTAAPVRGGLTGALPGSFAALEQLQVSAVLFQYWQVKFCTVDARRFYLNSASAVISATAGTIHSQTECLQVCVVAHLCAGCPPFTIYQSRATVNAAAGLYISLRGLQHCTLFTSLQVLVLAGHHISGTLPPAWTRLEQLRVLDVSHNSLTGSLPAWYSSMQQLAVLKVNDNQLVKTEAGAPEFYEFLLGAASKLQCLSVAGNKDTLLSATTAARLLSKAQQRSPVVPLDINAPDSSLCDPEPWK